MSDASFRSYTCSRCGLTDQPEYVFDVDAELCDTCSEQSERQRREEFYDWYFSTLDEFDLFYEGINNPKEKVAWQAEGF